MIILYNIIAKFGCYVHLPICNSKSEKAIQETGDQNIDMDWLIVNSEKFSQQTDNTPEMKTEEPIAAAQLEETNTETAAAVTAKSNKCDE